MPGKSEDKPYRRLLLVMAVLPLLLPVAACRQEANSGFQGYVEGEYLYLAPTLRLMAALSLRMSKPRQVPLPESGVRRPHIRRMHVVLPLPFGPRKP